MPSALKARLSILLCSAYLTLSFARWCSAAGDPSTRLDPSNLLILRNSSGEVTAVKSVADWQVRRAAIVAAMQEIMGPLPGEAKRCPLDVKIEEEVDCGTYVRRLISYASEPGGRVPAYLSIPKDALEGRHKVVVGLGGKANRAYASELAERGYVTLAPSYPLLANYQPDLHAFGYESGTMKAIWDNIRGVDLLESLAYVKPGGYGVIGHSLGGHNGVYTAVFDQRLKVIVSSCGLDSYGDYMGGDPKRWQPGQGWCQERYMPKLASYAGRLAEIPFDFPELIGALAPRFCFINAPLRDANFSWQSVDRVAAAARPVYDLFGVPNHLIVAHPDSEHDFPDEMRKKAYALFDEALK